MRLNLGLTLDALRFRRPVWRLLDTVRSSRPSLKVVPLSERIIHDYNRAAAADQIVLKGAALVNHKIALPPFSSITRSVIVGTLLGDASMQAQAANVGLKFEQRSHRVDYLLDLASLFNGYVGTGPRLRIIRNRYHRDYGVSCVFKTWTHPRFKVYEKMFYTVNSDGVRRKRVPVNIDRYLDAIALAYWFGDDGSCWFRDGHDTMLCFNTQNFTLDEQKLLIRALKVNFNLKARVGFDRKASGKVYYRLFLNTDQSRSLANIIQPHLHHVFHYKLQPFL